MTPNYNGTLAVKLNNYCHLSLSVCSDSTLRQTRWTCVRTLNVRIYNRSNSKPWWNYRLWFCPSMRSSAQSSWAKNANNSSRAFLLCSSRMYSSTTAIGYNKPLVLDAWKPRLCAGISEERTNNDINKRKHHEHVERKTDVRCLPKTVFSFCITCTKYYKIMSGNNQMVSCKKLQHNRANSCLTVSMPCPHWLRR